MSLSSPIQAPAIYPLLKEAAIQLPERSLYYHLSPIGVGTSTTESLTSYICRLAAAHNISIGTLYEFVIVPSLNKSYLAAPQHQGAASTLIGTFRNQLKNINGVGKTAREWADLFKRLTLQQDLDRLTFLPWSVVLTHNKLLRHTLAWCPACYEEMRHSREAPYQLLLWSIEAIRICVKHRIHLAEHCPRCNNLILTLTRRMRPGICPRCDQWLGEFSNETPTEQLLTASGLKWQEFICDNIGELISVKPVPPYEPSIAYIAKWLQICADNITEGKMQRLSALLSKSNLTVHEWKNANVKPTLFDLLRICYCLDIRLTELLTGSWETEKKVFQYTRFPDELEPIKKPRKARQFNYSEVKRRLEKYLYISPPISMRKVSVELGYDHGLLYSKIPDICRAISYRYNAFLQASYKTQRNRRALEVKQACIELYEKNVYLTGESVAKFLGKPSYVGRRDVRALVIATRKQLGQSR